MTFVIEADNLGRDFGERTALDGLSMKIEAGDVVALLGPNGAGKTTTVRLLNGVLAPNRGSARVLDLDPSVDGDELRRRTGVMTENAGLDDRLTALENVMVYAQIRGMDHSTARSESMKLLEQFGIGERAPDVVRGFSTGQRKRVALARAMVHDPEVLFLDEPTSGLDPEATRDVLDILDALATERGRTIILCTHFLAEANRLCKRMAILQRGHLAAFGRPEELAAELWQGVAIDLLVDRVTPLILETIQRSEGLLEVTAEGNRIRLRVDERRSVPDIVSTLVHMNVAVFEVTPLPATIEDVYFAVTKRNDKESA